MRMGAGQPRSTPAFRCNPARMVPRNSDPIVRSSASPPDLEAVHTRRGVWSTPYDSSTVFGIFPNLQAVTPVCSCASLPRRFRRPARRRIVRLSCRHRTHLRPSRSRRSLRRDSMRLAVAPLVRAPILSPPRRRRRVWGGELALPNQGQPSEIVVVWGNGQSGTIGELLGDSLVVRVVDRFGDPVGGPR